MQIMLLLVTFALTAFGNDLLVGYRQQGLKYQGPGEWRQSVEPVWVWDYPTIRLQYRASGLPKTGAAILTLRPGTVGPVTPGATNIENPFVAGMPVVAITAQDLVPNDVTHTLEIQLRGKMKTAQIDQLIFSVPAGAQVLIEDIQFLGPADVFPCAAGGPQLPENATKLATRGPSTCAGSPATSLRGRESLHIDGGGRKGGTLYLSLMTNFASVSSLGGLSFFNVSQPWDRWRIKESSETADVVARIKYTDGREEDQFPALVAERRHALLNRKAALYALTLDSSRGVSSVELLDRSPHVQLALFSAGLSPEAAPKTADELNLPAPQPRGRKAGEADLKGSKWYQMTASEATVKAKLDAAPFKGGRNLSLSVTNVSREPQEFKLVFPSVAIRPAEDPNDTYYVFPRQGAVIDNVEQTLDSLYSGRFPVQFVDVFAPKAKRGACVIVQDTSGRVKRFTLKKAGANVEVNVEYTVRLAPGETFRPPDARIVLHGGDWREGFDAYRSWVKTWYKPAGPRPEWVKTAFWARRDYPVGGSGRLFDVDKNRYTYEELIRDGEAFGGIDFIDISGWAMSNTAGRVGDYPIELGGTEDLRRNIAIGDKAGVPTGLYFEGYLIDKNSKVGRQFGEKWQIIDAKGHGRWWSGGSPELFACPYVPEWQQFLSNRMATVARDVGAAAVYLDEYGFGQSRCFATSHGHAPGLETLAGEIAMTQHVRRALDESGMRKTILYLEETPPDVLAPYFDAALCYNLLFADPKLSPLKLNLWRFAFPDVRLWDILSSGIDPRALTAEDFRLSLWHGNGLWIKGHSDTWYGADLLAFMRRSHGLLKQHAAAFAGAADPLVESPHPAVFINRFRGGQETVYTLFNASYRTLHFRFQGKERALGPRDVDVIAGTR